jgi:hypothetical protein
MLTSSARGITSWADACPEAVGLASFLARAAHSAAMDSTAIRARKPRLFPRRLICLLMLLFLVVDATQLSASIVCKTTLNHTFAFYHVILSLDKV